MTICIVFEAIFPGHWYAIGDCVRQN